MDEQTYKDIDCPLCKLDLGYQNIREAYLCDELFGEGKICMRENLCEKCHSIVIEIESMCSCGSPSTIIGQRNGQSNIYQCEDCFEEHMNEIRTSNIPSNN